MRKKIFAAAALALTVGGVVAKAHASETKPRYYYLSIDVTGHIWCFQDGSDCKVG